MRAAAEAAAAVAASEELRRQLAGRFAFASPLNLFRHTQSLTHADALKFAEAGAKWKAELDALLLERSQVRLGRARSERARLSSAFFL